MSAHPLIEGLRAAPGERSQHRTWSVEAEGATQGPVGLSAEALRFRPGTPLPDPPATARRIAAGAGYLLDPLEVIESAPDRVLLRTPQAAVSSTPSAGTDAPPREEYYEMWVGTDEVSLERFAGGAGRARERRPLNLTWEQADRLARDVTGETTDRV